MFPFRSSETKFFEALLKNHELSKLQAVDFGDLHRYLKFGVKSFFGDLHRYLKFRVKSFFFGNLHMYLKFGVKSFFLEICTGI
jgi:hypothetical protein